MMTKRIRSCVDVCGRISDCSTKLLLLVFLILFLAPKSGAVEFRFEKVTDQSTPIPNGVGTFQSFGVTNTGPVLNSGNVAFYASGSSGQAGVYAMIDGSLRVVADINTPYPGGSASFSSVNENIEPSIFGDQVSLFGSSTSGASGVFLEELGSFNVIADTNTTMPGKSTTFTRFTETSTSSGNVAFIGDHIPVEPGETERGVYKKVGGVLSKVVELGEMMPGTTHSFGSLQDVLISSSDVVVKGGNSSHSGIYTDRGGTFRKVVDSGTPMPNGNGALFVLILQPAIGDEGITFYGRASGGLHGIYIEQNGMLSTIVDSNTPIPGGAGLFTIGTAHAFDGERVVFSTSQSDGLYLADQTNIVKIIDSTDTLDGKSPNRFILEAEAFKGGQLAFKVQFSDGSLGIYKAIIVPEPTGFLLIVIGLIVVGTRNRNR